MKTPEAPISVTSQPLRRSGIPGLIEARDWPSPYGVGLRVITDHYEVLTTVGDPDLLAVLPAFMESAHGAYNRQLPIAVQPRVRSSVYLFADRDQWEDFTRGFAGDQAGVFLKIKEGAYCHNGCCVAYNLGFDRTLAALGHEGWHQFASRHFRYRLPSWLDEGIAMLHENPIWVDQQIRFEVTTNAYRVDVLKECLGSGDLMPLSQVLSVSPGEVMASNRAALGFYSQAYALVRFLQSAAGGKYRPCYQKMVWDGLSGAWPLEEADRHIAENRNAPRTLDWNRKVATTLFRHYVTYDLGGIEEEYLAFCRQIVRE